MIQLQVAAHQNGLDVAECGLRLVHEHFLGHLFAPLGPVQFVICVAVQGGPAKELGQRLHVQDIHIENECIFFLI